MMLIAAITLHCVIINTFVGQSVKDRVACVPVHPYHRTLAVLFFILSWLVQQYKLLYKPWGLSMGEGDFRPSTAPRPLDRFSWNLKYITTSWTQPCTQNSGGYINTGDLGK